MSLNPSHNHHSGFLVSVETTNNCIFRYADFEQARQDYGNQRLDTQLQNKYIGKARCLMAVAIAAKILALVKDPGSEEDMMLRENGNFQKTDTSLAESRERSIKLPPYMNSRQAN